MQQEEITALFDQQASSYDQQPGNIDSVSVRIWLFLANNSLITNSMYRSRRAPGATSTSSATSVPDGLMERSVYWAHGAAIAGLAWGARCCWLGCIAYATLVCATLISAWTPPARRAPTRFMSQLASRLPTAVRCTAATWTADDPMRQRSSGVRTGYPPRLIRSVWP